MALGITPRLVRGVLASAGPLLLGGRVSCNSKFLVAIQLGFHYFNNSVFLELAAVAVPSQVRFQSTEANKVETRRKD